MNSESEHPLAAHLMAGLLFLAGLLAAAFSWRLVWAWQHDPSLRFGALSFLSWLPAVLVHYRRLPAEWSTLRVLTLAAAGLCLILGIVGELQVLVYFAFVGFFTLPVWAPWRRLMLCAGALLWMPIWVWLVGPYLGTQTAWLSLVLALGLSATSILMSLLKYEANAPDSTL